ncbi:anti-sigma regulatory factor (Ser/Thr protein kinase) [Janthinobacterium sp. CG_23.3]|uniref:ATP-binding protein n=1 Tax=Janthinobacterium sp. CG_23.3 TaxID=3349634 RepID=UPI0038D4A9CC
MDTLLNLAGPQHNYRIGEPSEVAAARRAGNELGRRLGWDEVRVGQLALLVTEAATNIVKHAGHGEILLRPLYGYDGGGAAVLGVEVTALDAGPGIANLARQMQDGHSTAGSYGVGLGAMRRLAHEFDAYTAPERGTVLRMALWGAAPLPPAPAPLFQLGAVCLPLPGEQECGDAWLATPGRDSLTLLVADGLGHGPQAAAAAQAALAAAAGDSASAPAALLQRLHAALHGSRGAALAIARIDLGAAQLRFAGVGNIAGCVFDGAARRHLLSHNGIVGSNLRKVQEFALPWHAGATLVLHSDGVGTRWNLDHYPGLERCHPGIIAALLYRDFGRGRDDVGVLVLRDCGAGAEAAV